MDIMEKSGYIPDLTRVSLLGRAITMLLRLGIQKVNNNVDLYE